MTDLSTDDTVSFPAVAGSFPAVAGDESVPVPEASASALGLSAGASAFGGSPLAVAGEAPATDLVSCPNCGTAAMVTLNRRDSRDFCRTCDYPLFWTPGAIVRDAAPGSGESLRRLPGQAGRVTVASQPCPSCAEPNSLSAIICIRCSGPMKIEVAPPPPTPVYVAPAPVIAPVLVEEKSVPWWVWALLAAGLVATVTLIVLAVTGVLG